ncbi:hypothetical protein GCM10020260_12030 [Nesterenkonia halobia]|uniref:Uncharacterized protein n=1 Tax=Nesterenkonia halobia TaxID=37922 RepID=A0ABP6RFX0_9MICC
MAVEDVLRDRPDERDGPRTMEDIEAQRRDQAEEAPTYSADEWPEAP